MQPHGYFTALTVLILLVSRAHCNGSDDEDNMMCYKPPPPPGASTDNLFLLNVTIPTPPGLEAVEKNVSMNLNTNCGLTVVYCFTMNIWVRDSYLECNQTNPAQKKAVIKESRFTAVHVRQTAEDSYETDVEATFTLEYFDASAGLLTMTCAVKFKESVGILRDSFVSPLVSLQLQGCPHARHGMHCDQACSCAVGVECHAFTGDCVCPIGLHGKSCSRAKPLLMLTSPSTVFVRYGESVTLTCVAHGMVPTFGLWDHNKIKLGSRSQTQDVPYYPRPFLLNTTITGARPEANGVYTCSVVNNEVYSQSLRVIVKDIPEPFLEAPSNQSVILGNRVELRCRTKPEAGTLTWVIGNQTIFQWPTDTVSNQTSGQWPVVKERNQTVSVIFEAVRFEDAGRYRCIVGHEGANDDSVKDAWLTVESQGSPPFITTLSRSGLLRGILTLREEQSISLMCPVREAYPQPSIAWFVGDEDRSAEAKLESRTSTNGVSYDVISNFTFRPTWHDDGKAVVCIANIPNFHPNRSRNVHLDVTYAPKVTVSPSDKTVQPGDNPLFTCNAPANPPVSNYTWTLQQKNGTIIKRYTGRSVRVRAQNPEDNMATLTCYAANDVGTSNNKAVIKVFDDSDQHNKVPWFVMITVLSVLVVLMVAVPIVIYKYRGKIQDLFFKNRRAEMQAEGKTHDVFVAYKGGGEEEVFVTRSLVPKLEEWGCDVCVHYQNFSPGREIEDNITAAVSSCRKTLLVLSLDFISSEWCYYEFLCAMDEMLRNQTNFIIPLMFQEIRTEELCHSMQNLLDTVSFIPWPAAGQGQGQTNEFWKLLKRAVETEYNVNNNVDADEVENNNNNLAVVIDENVNLI